MTTSPHLDAAAGVRRIPNPWIIVAAIVAVCAVLPILATVVFGYDGALRALWQWLSLQSGDDSWYPIGQAMKYVEEHGTGDGLYQETYFRTDHQFIYSPPSVVLFLALKSVGVNFGSAPSANLLSWVVLPIMVGVLFWIGRLLQGPDVKADHRRDAAIAFVSLALVFFFYPITKGFAVGQIQTWLTLLLMLSVLLWIKQRKLAAGMLIGLFAIVKPHISLIIVWAALRREWHFVAGFCLVTLAMLAISTIFLGWSVNTQYLELLSYLSSRGESYRASHTFESTLHRMLHNGNNLEWDGTHTQVVYIAWVHYVASALGFSLVLAAILSGRAYTRAASLIDFLMIIISIILASPVAYEHHYGILAVIFLVVLFHACSARQGLVVVGIAASVALFLAANSWGVLDTTADSSWNFVQSYRLWGALLALGALYGLKQYLGTHDIATGSPGWSGSAPTLAQADR